MWILIACYYLPIQGLAITSEHVFSSSSITSTDHHNRLAPDIFEALQILKYSYKTGTVLSDSEIKAHEALESEEDAFWIQYDDETAVA